MTRNQAKVFDLWKDDYNIVLSGSAGTGKTTLSIYLALQEILNPDSEYEKLTIIRGTTQTKDIGFLKGSIEEKISVFETPYIQIFDDLFKRKNQYKFMKESGLVEFISTSFLRGQNLSNTIIVIDESAGLTYHEIATCITRCAKSSKIVIIGDVKQNDLIYKRNETSGFAQFLEVSTMMPSVRQVTFTIADCVRSGLAKEFLEADEMWDNRQHLKK